jgi:signal transduction histidine kinase
MDSTIDITLSDEQYCVMCTITNKGIGIPESEKEHIFKQYFRASNSRSHENGTGIGLFGTKQIIEKHGGKITFESVEGGYTSFIITLPLHQK